MKDCLSFLFSGPCFTGWKYHYDKFQKNHFYKRWREYHLKRSSFVAQGDKCHRRGGNQAKELHIIFYKQRFFSTQPQCCLTFLQTELQMLLRCCLIHITIIIMRHSLYLVAIFVPMSRPMSINVISLWSVFNFQPHFHFHQSYNLIKTDALGFCAFFGISPTIFGL